MKWKRKPINIKAEEEIITGMIVNDRFITELQPIYKRSLLSLPYARTVGEWCNTYYSTYGKAPANTIQEIFSSKQNSGTIDETQLELIEKFLINLSEKYEDGKSFNVEYELDKAEKYLRLKKAEQLRDNISTLLSKKDIDGAERQIADYVRVARPESIGIDVIANESALYSIFEEDDILFQLSGAVGELVHPFLRGDFFAVAAPMKRGKSWWLEEIAVQALANNLKVLFVSLEMTSQDMMRRFYQCFLSETKREMEIEYPFFDDEDVIDSETMYQKGLSLDKVLSKSKSLKKQFGKNTFKLICFSSGGITVEELKMHLENMEHYEKFVPDIVVIDYADILAPSYGSNETRHKIDHIWKSLRGLAQDKHIMVATATQLNKATFSRDAEASDMAEDIRKIAHVTGMMALNQSPDDKKEGLMRISMLALRNENFIPGKEVLVTQCLAIAKPYLDSRLIKK
jgi:replicative DNA helicase